jgi:hypothetical protein
MLFAILSLVRRSSATPCDMSFLSPTARSGYESSRNPGVLRVAVTDGGPELKLDRGGMFSTM